MKAMREAQQQNSVQELHREEMISSSDKATEIMDTPVSLRDKYRFVDEIGHGAQGRLFKAKRLIDGKTVVIKQLNISSIKTWKEYELFHREAEVLRTLKLKGVAQFYDAIDCLEDEPPCSYIVQEYIEGASLKKMLDDSHRFKVETVYDILIQTLKILDELHHHDPPVIHRDIKPSNLMISPDEKGNYRVTIVDFGAVANPQVQGGGSTVAGTYGYMPPEQLMGKPEPASDIYALASVAVQLFSGKSPADIPTKDFRLIFEPEMQDKPHALVTTLRQMLEPKVENRLTDIHEIIQRFTNYQNNLFEDEKKGAIIKSSEGVTTVHNEKLDKLRYICEPGCFDIWQELPDELPRPIPIQYYNIINNQTNLRQNGSFFVKVKSTPGEISVKSVFFGVLFFIALIFMLAGIGICISSGVSGPDGMSGPFVVVFSLILAGLSWLFIFYKPRVEVFEVPHRINNGLKAGVARNQFESLLKNGRKSIGVITQIDFLPYLKNNVEILSLKQFICHEMPAFRVKYKFNPPDDRRSEDLVHEFITHVEPENHYGLGDPIPILYQIEDKYFYDEVYSMPCPVPLSDITHFESLVCMSSSQAAEESLDVDDTVGVIADLDIDKLKVSSSVKYNLKNKDYILALKMLSYDVNFNDTSYLHAKQLLLLLWKHNSRKFGEDCIDCLFDIIYPYRAKNTYRKDAIQMIGKLILTKPISANMIKILDKLFVKICCSSAEYYAGIESYKNHEFDPIWDALILLYQERKLSGGTRLKIIEGFKYWGTVESARKFNEVIDKFDLPNKTENIRSFRSWYRFHFND